MKFGLDDKVIEDIQKVFQENFKIVSVVLFGSRAKGNYREGSDIDLAVQGRDITLDDILSLSSKLDDLNLPYEIDLINYSTLKDEGVIEHIDRVGVSFYNQWKEYKLDEVYEFTSGLSKSRDQFGFGFPFLGYTDIFDNYFLDNELSSLVNSTEKERKACSIKRGDVFLTRTSETDEDLGMSSVALKDYPDATFNGFTKRLRPIGAVAVLPEYAAFYFRSPRFRAAVSGMSSVTTRASLNNGMLSALKIAVPPFATQERIAELLLSLHEKIDLLQRQNKTLEQLAETLFRQWFVEEELEQVRLGDIVVFDPREKVDKNKEYRFFDMKCVSQEGMAISEGIIRTVNSGSAFRSNDTLLAKITPCLENGKTGFVMNLKEGELARGSTEFIVMRPKEGTSPYFVYCLARSSDFRDTAILSMTGTSGRQRVQTDVLKEYLIGFSENNMKEFNKTASNLFGKIKQNQNQIRNLWNLREALLPKLMSGEVRVKM